MAIAREAANAGALRRCVAVTTDDLAPVVEADEFVGAPTGGVEHGEPAVLQHEHRWVRAWPGARRTIISPSLSCAGAEHRHDDKYSGRGHGQSSGDASHGAGAGGRVFIGSSVWV